MSKVKITLVKGLAKRTPVQKATLKALGFKRSYQTLEKDVNPAIQGMIDQVKHLLTIENI
jgi:large subunit ribosomal protein L30